MSAAALIPLQVQTPQPQTPLQTIGGIMQLRQGMSEIALRQAQVDQAKQQQQLIQAEQMQKNRDISDVNSYTSLIKDPGVQAAFNGNADVSSFQKAGIQPKFIDELLKSRQDKLAGLATLDKDTLTNRATALGQLKDTAVNLMAPGDDGKPPDLQTINSRYQSAREGLAPLSRMAGIDAALPSTIGSPEQLQQVQAALHGGEALYTAALAHKETQQKTEADTAKAASDTAAANLSNFKLNLMKGMDANGVAAGVDNLIDPQKYPQANRDAHAAAAVARLSGDPAKVSEAVQKVYDEQVGAVQKAKSLQPIEVATAGQKANAEIPAHVAGAVQTQQALAKLSPDAFSPIADTTSRHEAMNEYDKTAKEYSDKIGQTQTLLDTIDAAQKGNKSAPGVIPIEQVRSVLSSGRVNSRELAAVSSGAGSLMDRIEGGIGKIAAGEPIPPDILRDTATLATIQQQAAKRSYQAGLNRLSSRGADVAKLPDPLHGMAGAGTQPIALKDGTFLTPHDQATADRFRQDYPDLIK